MKNILILFWVRYIVAVYKNYTQIIINSGDTVLNKMNRIDKVVGGDHRKGEFRFLMKILYTMHSGKRHESIQPVSYVSFKKDNGIIF